MCKLIQVLRLASHNDAMSLLFSDEKFEFLCSENHRFQGLIVPPGMSDPVVLCDIPVSKIMHLGFAGADIAFSKALETVGVSI